MQKKILVLGAGGVGGYFGGRLIQAGGDVTFLVREKRHALLQEKGLQIKSPCGDVILNVKSITKDVVDPIYDYVFLTAKAYDLDDAIETVAPFMKGGAVLVPFLNGMAHLRRLNEAFGCDNVLGGVVMISSTLTDEGIIEHFNDSAIMFFGEQTDNATLFVSPRVQLLQDVFANAQGVCVKADTHIIARMWEKWVQLSALAAMTCLMRASIGEIVRIAQGRSAMTQFIDTNLQLAAHFGYPLKPATIMGIKNILLDETSTTTASMLRDLEKGGRVENDHILGDLLKHADRAQIAHPLLALAYTHLKTYENRHLV